MYDLSGCRDSADVPVLINDWKYLVDSLKVTNWGKDQSYLYHNGKPLVVLSPINQIFRDRGKFFWKQITGAISNGTQMLYVAKFDEVDEATAIFKISKKPPVGASSFVTFEEDIPSDYYLYLTCYAGRMLRTDTIPNRRSNASYEVALEIKRVILTI